MSAKGMRRFLWCVSIAMATVVPPCLAQPCIDWQKIGMSPRGYHGMVFDSKRNVTVCFGGEGDGSSETWEWDGRKWSLRATTGPQYYTSNVMAYDSHRGVTVLHRAYPTPQTWEWDGEAWEFRTSDGPYLFAGAMTFDSARHVTVLFGGQPGNGNPYSNDTWEWDGNEWQLVSSEGPAPRVYARMVYDVVRAESILFGGTTNGVNGMQETWAWNGKTWSLKASSGPSPRFWSAMTYRSDTNRILLFSGFTNGWSVALPDLWEWDGQSWTFLGNAPVSPRGGHGMIYDTSRDATVVYGGHFNSGYKGDTWEYSKSEWILRIPDQAQRSNAAVVYDPIRQRMIRFGGEYDGFKNDLWEWDGHTWTLRIPNGPIPSPRRSAAMAYDETRNLSVMFGGINSHNGTGVGDTWEWNGVTGVWTLRATSGPPSGAAIGMVYDQARKQIVMLCSLGYDNGHQTWVWNGTVGSWELISLSGPQWSGDGALAYDQARGVIVLKIDSTLWGLSETWEWNGNQWQQKVVTNPPPRNGKRLCYVESLSKTVLFGGGVLKKVIWVWDGENWSERPYASGPNPRTGHSMSYDPLRGLMVMVGGSDFFGTKTDTWELVLPTPPSIIHPSPQTVPLFGTAVFSTTASGKGYLNYQWRKDGIALQDDDHISGAQTHTLTISPASLTDEGQYDVAVVDSVCEEISLSVALSVEPEQGDVNADGLVNEIDLLMLIDAWGFCYWCDEDLDNNHFVNAVDLLILISHWNP